MLALGSSQPWTKALESITGSQKMDATPFLHYFDPLFKWLEKNNSNENVDWSVNWTPCRVFLYNVICVSLFLAGGASWSMDAIF